MPTVLAAVIPDNGTMSDVVDLTGVTAVVGIIMPSDWTGAVVTVCGSADGSFFHELHDGQSGVELTFNARPGSLVMLNPNRMRSCIAVKLRSGTRDAPVPQAELRQFGIVVEGDVADIPVQPGTGTVAHVIENSSSGYHGIEQMFQARGPMSVAVQAWLKSTSRNAGFEIFDADGNGARVYFDLSANEVYANSADSGFSIFNEAIEGPGPNGWWTCSAVIDLHPISPAHTLRIGIDYGQAGGQSYTGDGASFIEVWQPSLTEDGGSDLLISPDDLTNSIWQPKNASVVNVPDSVLPAP